MSPSSRALLHAAMTSAIASYRRGPATAGRRLTAGCPEPGDLHPVFGEGAGLVGADHVGRAEGLHRAQPLDDRPPPDQVADPDRQRERDDRQQALRHVAGDQPDREHQRLRERQARPERGDRQERRGHHHGDDRDQPGDPADLAFQRALLGLDPLGEGGDAAELGAHAGGHDDGAGLAAGAGGAAEDQIPGLQQRDPENRPSPRSAPPAPTRRSASRRRLRPSRPASARPRRSGRLPR